MMCRYNIARQNLIVDRIVEAIKLNCNIVGEVYEDKQVKISTADGKMVNLFIHHLDQIFGTGQNK
jgi:selenophosphate synthetase-related protein